MQLKPQDKEVVLRWAYVHVRRNTRLDCFHLSLILGRHEYKKAASWLVTLCDLLTACMLFIICSFGKDYTCEFVTQF